MPDNSSDFVSPDAECTVVAGSETSLTQCQQALSSDQAACFAISRLVDVFSFSESDFVCAGVYNLPLGSSHRLYDAIQPDLRLDQLLFRGHRLDPLWVESDYNHRQQLSS